MEWVKQFNEWIQVSRKELENIRPVFEETSSLINGLVEKKHIKQEPFYKLPQNYHYKNRIRK